MGLMINQESVSYYNSTSIISSLAYLVAASDFSFAREKGRDLTQSYDESHRKAQKPT